MSRRARHSQAPSSPRPQAEQRGLAGLSAQQWLCGVMVFCQVWIYAYSMLEDQTGTAAWWALAFAPLGGAVVWLPVALLLRACPGRGLCGALRQALPPLAGSLVCAWLGLLLAADGVTALCSLCNLASMTLLQDVDEKTVAFFTGAGLTLLLWAGDVTAASRLAVLLRGALLIGVTAMCVGLLTAGRIENLYPLGGYGVFAAVGAGALAGGGCWAVAALGFAPETAQGSPAPGVRRGLGVVGLATLAALVAQFAFRWELPYLILSPDEGPALALPTEYVLNWGGVHTLLTLFQALLLALAAQGALCYGSHALAQALPQGLPGTPRVWARAALSALAFAAAWYRLPTMLDYAMLAWLPWRLPAAAIPLWAAWGLTRYLHKKGENVWRNPSA